MSRVFLFILVCQVLQESEKIMILFVLILVLSENEKDKLNCKEYLATKAFVLTCISFQK